MPARGWNKLGVEAQLPDEYRTVFGVPPEPWPDIADDYVFGSEWQPPGVTYVFSEDAAIRRAAEHGNTWAWVLEHLAGLSRLVDGSATWRVPVRYARAQVVGALAGGEQLIHSLAYRPTDESAPVTGQALHDFAALIGTQVTAWMQIVAVQNSLSAALSYTEVRISYIEQTSGTAKDGSGGDQHTLVPTIVVPIAANPTGGASGNALPYEVACALTLQTDTRGPRTRGRVYLGGLSPVLMAANGLFSADGVGALANYWGDSMVKYFHDHTTWRLNVVSRRSATAREVQGIAVGVVPDAQRRRRNQLAENYAQAWGNPPGAIPPG